MNKCSNCGAEFEGNFCPECGSPSDAPKTCPHCGAPLKPNAKFCSNCGHRFLQQDAPAATVAQPAQSAPKAATGIRWQQNDILHKIMLYAPLVIFVLWAVLMFAFMAAPVMKGDLIGEDINVYGFFNEELLGGDEDLEAIVPAAAALLAFSAIAVVYAGWLVWVQLKGKKLTRWISQWASILLYVIVIICTAVIAVKFNALADMSGDFDEFGLFAASSFDDMGDFGDFGDFGDLDDFGNVKGPFVGVTVAFTVVFMVLHVGALVACKLLSVGTLTAEERAEVQQNFNNWLQKRAEKKELRQKTNQYCAQRKQAVKKRLKTEPFIRVRAASIVCVIFLVCVVISSLTLSIANFSHARYETDFDYYFEHLSFDRYTFSSFEALWDSDRWISIRTQTEGFYSHVEYVHDRYYVDEVENGEMDFEEWLNVNSEEGSVIQSYYSYEDFYNDGSEFSYDIPPAILDTSNMKKVSAAELYNLGVDDYLKQRYPNGFADFTKEVTGESFTTEEEYKELCRSKLYDYYKQDWDVNSEDIIAPVAIMVLSAVAIVFTVLTCITTFRKRWPKSVIFCWITLVCCFVDMVFGNILFVDLFTSSGNTFGEAEEIMRTLSLITVIVGILCGFISLFIQSADKRKARKRWRCEYDEQAAAEGNEIAKMLLQQSHPKKSKDGHSSQNDPK